MSPARAPRADAVRNRKQILAAAKEQVTLRGHGVGMDEIAMAAGVAVGTLYRHFPTKSDLVAAVVADDVTHVANDAEAACERVASGARAGEEVIAFFGRVIEQSATNYAVKAAVQVLGANPGHQADERRASRAVAKLIRTAQAEGDLRPDLTIDDIYLLFSTAPTDQPAAVRTRWLALVLPGLRPDARGSARSPSRRKG